MKQILGIFCLTFILLAGCQAPAAVDTFTDADIDAIMEGVQGFPTAVLEGRWSDVATYY